MQNPQKPVRCSEDIQIGLMVSDLIDGESKTWKTDIIRQIFNRQDADRICSMHISRRLPPDKMFWRYTSNGNFSVKSAYQVIKNQWEQSNTDITSSSNISSVWKKMWNFRLPPKIKHFIWRACLDTLPTKEKILQRGMTIDPPCGLCGEKTETLAHVILECNESVHIWSRCPLRMDTSQIKFASFKNFLWCTMSTYPQDVVEYLCIMAWCIWTARNKFYFEQKHFDGMRIQKTAQELFLEIFGDKTKTGAHKKSSINVAKWTPPPLGTFKLNTDGAIYTNGTIGLGFIIRDAEGNAILAGSKNSNLDGNSTIVEGLSLLFALQSACTAGIQGIHVESDCKVIIDGIQGKEISDPHGDLLIDDILSVAEAANCLSFKHIPREANGVAHSIAHFNRNPETEVVWSNEIPQPIADLLHRDVMNI
ncbi:hypothetical protein DH2020_037388 [Rehmannia glutinosa]|uniref:Uncharacterized protein n=1 Tax=Rehmannia glutinosa TaxID=99300 RepID=A0ABR0V208_REHGL